MYNLQKNIKIFIFFLILLTKAYGKVYDCFMFFNELEVLEIRLNELYHVVDHFVLVESAETHRRGTPKPFYFEEEKERFQPFLDKIIHIKLDEHIDCAAIWSKENYSQGWERENWQRNQIMRGLKDCEPEDLILISDVDEIIPASIVPKLYANTATTPYIGFFHRMYRFFLNRKTKKPFWWQGTVALRYKHLVKISPQQARRLHCPKKIPMWYMGWHFTTMGGFNRANDKRWSMVEGSDILLSYEQWRFRVDALPLVPIDDTFPDFVQKNINYLINMGLIDKIHETSSS